MWHRQPHFNGYGSLQEQRIDTKNLHYSTNANDSSISCVYKQETPIYYRPTAHVNSINEIDQSKSMNSNRPVEPKARKENVSPCWNWTIFDPVYNVCLFRPESSSVGSMKNLDEESELTVNLPNWLIVLLENCDSSKISTLEKENRSSTPETDDGYQSSSDVSRSEIRKHSNKVQVPFCSSVHPRRFSNEPNVGSNNQKSKFIAPRFERISNSKQYSTNFTNRSQSRSNRRR